ncbi:MAG: NifU family protein [Acetobacter sp.]|nr:NifU family protein [Acetobacter sp.]
MIIEEKNITTTETLLFFTTPQPIRGTFYHTPNASTNLQMMQNIANTNLAKTILLTTDFLYIESTSEETLEDLSAIALAEIDDFVSENLPIQSAPEQNLPEKICLILKIIIAPFLQKDGGDIEFIKEENGTVYVHFLGKCHGCPYAEKTLKNRVEKNLIRYLPEIREATLI